MPGAGAWVRKRGYKWHYYGWTEGTAVHTRCGVAFAEHDVEMSPKVPDPPFEYCSRCYTKYAREPTPPEPVNWDEVWPGVVVLAVVGGVIWAVVQVVGFISSLFK